MFISKYALFIQHHNGHGLIQMQLKKACNPLIKSEDLYHQAPVYTVWLGGAVMQAGTPEASCLDKALQKPSGGFSCTVIEPRFAAQLEHEIHAPLVRVAGLGTQIGSV